MKPERFPDRLYVTYGRIGQNEQERSFAGRREGDVYLVSRMAF